MINKFIKFAVITLGIYIGIGVLLLTLSDYFSYSSQKATCSDIMSGKDYAKCTEEQKHNQYDMCQHYFEICVSQQQTFLKNVMYTFSNPIYYYSYILIWPEVFLPPQLDSAP